MAQNGLAREAIISPPCLAIGPAIDCEAMTKRMKNANGSRAALGVVLGLFAALVANNPVQAQQSPECMRLRQQIADASHSDQGGQYQAAAARQREELDRTTAYAHSIGCDRRQFLFFGSAPPPQCGEINAQIGRMRANLEELQRAGGGGGRGDLVARYNAECANPQQAPNFLSALFGGGRQNNDVDTQPLNPDTAPIEEKPLDANPGEARAGSKAVCVRSCDGSFFPVSYSASGGKLQSLDDMCHALCPNADVSLYTYPASGEIEQAVSINGARYMDSPTALKFRQSYDPTCSCRKRGQSWADALANAEIKLGRESKGDIYVTPEKSAEMSRPRIDPRAAKAAAKSTPTPADAAALNANSADPTVDNLSQQAATISREASGIAGGEAQTGARYSEGQGETTETIGPDGVKRRVRIIDPAL